MTGFRDFLKLHEQGQAPYPGAYPQDPFATLRPVERQAVEAYINAMRMPQNQRQQALQSVDRNALSQAERQMAEFLSDEEIQQATRQGGGAAGGWGFANSPIIDAVLRKTQSGSVGQRRELHADREKPGAMAPPESVQGGRQAVQRGMQPQATQQQQQQQGGGGGWFGNWFGR